MNAQKRFDAAMSESQKTLSDDELDAVSGRYIRKAQLSPREFWNKATSTLLTMAKRPDNKASWMQKQEELSYSIPDESGNNHQ